MKPVQERLHIDELKRVEKQTNTLLKAWRTLNKNYRQLQEDYDKLNIRHNLTVQEHQETLSQRAEEYRAALEQADQRWRKNIRKPWMPCRQNWIRRIAASRP